MIDELATSKFHSDGYLLVSSVFNMDEIDFLRERLIEKFDSDIRGKSDTPDCLYDIVNRFQDFEFLLENETFLNIFREILGADFVFIPEMVAHDSSFGDWHKDTTSLEYSGHLFHYESDFLMIQTAVYLQDNTEEYGGGLVAVPGSHMEPYPDKYVASRMIAHKNSAKFGVRIKNHLLRFLKICGYKPKELTRSGQVHIPSKAGDVVIFNLKLDHKAAWPKRNIPNERRKLALYFVCSKNNRHARAYVNYLQSRPEFSYLKDHKYSERLLKLSNNIFL